jgi:hypothetical protein
VTGGDADGVCLELEGTDPTLVFSTERASFRVAVSEFQDGPLKHPVGGLDLVVTFEMLPLGVGARDASATWVDESPLEKRTPYWVRVLQTDGGKAWSSPIWITP